MLEKTLGGKVDMNAINRMTKQNATKDRLRKKMEQRQQAQAQAQVQQIGANNYVVSIGDEKQEKSGLKPLVASQAQGPALSEEELIKLFNSSDTNSKKQKKSKKAK